MIFTWRPWKEISNSLLSLHFSYTIQSLLFDLISLIFKEVDKENKIWSLMRYRYRHLFSLTLLIFNPFQYYSPQGSDSIITSYLFERVYTFLHPLAT